MVVEKTCYVNQGLNDALIWFWAGIGQGLFKNSRFTDIQTMERAEQHDLKSLISSKATL